MHAPLLLAGAGLANGLLAYRLRMLRPEVPIVLLERDAAVGGNHTWSFHEHDLTATQHAWLEPFVAHRWPEYEVRFPALRRRLRSGYRSVSSARFAQVLAAALGGAVRCGVGIERVEPTAVWLDGGERLSGCAVVDGRGARDSAHLVLGYQKFLGREVRLAQPHGLAGPIVMDATVAQHDGLRFVYVLPLTDRTMLIEDTYYADGPALAHDALRERIERYACGHGWTVEQVLREETGVLPITLAGDARAFWDEGTPGVARSGLAAALFHPTTGYSLPDAVRLADALAALPVLDAASVHAATRAHALAQWRRQGFFRLLNRMLFGAAAPSRRYAVLQRFYRLPEPLIRRFYAGRPTWADKARILAGRPPVPVLDALRVMWPGALAGPTGGHRT